MQVRRITTDRVDVRFARGRNIGSNRIDVLTGPNGSGKTEVLTKLAASLGERRADDRVHISIYRDSAMGDRSKAGDESFIRVVAQTLSPFSRFPEPDKSPTSLAVRYLEEAETDPYLALGFHRGPKAPRPARQILEQALFGLSESLQAVPIMLRLLRELGFQEYFDLRYRKGLAVKGALFLNSEEVVSRYLDQMPSRAMSIKMSSVVGREMREVGRAKLEALILESVHLVKDYALVSGANIHFRFGIHRNRTSFDFATLQAISLLRRLGLLALTECGLTRKDGLTIDIASASSGQQQLICSVFSLGVALRRDSLVLIDEPELSLHPQWQLAYMDYIRAMLEETSGCHFLIATHSPLVVQRAQSLGATILQVENGRIVSSDVESQPSVESTLIDVFDTAVPGSQHLANELFAAVTKGEEGSDSDRAEARATVERLRRVYERVEARDEESITLIDQALELLALGLERTKDV